MADSIAVDNDITSILEMWLEKDEIVARNMGEIGASIKFDIEEAVREIVRLRHFLPILDGGRGDLRGCNVCGGGTVLIRGRYPKTPKRRVCPTCLQERLETIHEMTSKDYGCAKQVSGDTDWNTS